MTLITTDEAFDPIIYQHSREKDEERFGDRHLTSHFHHTDAEGHSRVTFVVMSDPQCKVRVSFTFDPVRSVGQLLRNYFVLLIAPCFSLTLLGYYLQSKEFFQG